MVARPVSPNKAMNNPDCSAPTLLLHPSMCSSTFSCHFLPIQMYKDARNESASLAYNCAIEKKKEL